MGVAEIRNLKAKALEPQQLKKYTIRKVSEKRAKKLLEDKATLENDKLFYAEHWRSCPHKCEECGKNLGKEPLTIFFHHALPKRNFPQFRHTHENIIILCPDHHRQAEDDIDKVPVVNRRTEEITKLLQP